MRELTLSSARWAISASEERLNISIDHTAKYNDYYVPSPVQLMESVKETFVFSYDADFIYVRCWYTSESYNV